MSEWWAYVPRNSGAIEKRVSHCGYGALNFFPAVMKQCGERARSCGWPERDHLTQADLDSAQRPLKCVPRAVGPLLIDGTEKGHREMEVFRSKELRHQERGRLDSFRVILEML